MSQRTFLCLALLSGACASPDAPEKPSVTTSPAPSVTPRTAALRHAVGAPVVVRWIDRGPSADVGAGAGLVLVARVEQTGALGVPIDVRVETPAGASLTRGPARYTVPSGPPGSVHEVELEFSLRGVPDGDLALVADARGDGAGFHARVPYRFGRAEPEGPRTPPLAPTPLVVGGVSLGRPVELRPVAR